MVKEKSFNLTNQLCFYAKMILTTNLTKTL